MELKQLQEGGTLGAGGTEDPEEMIIVKKETGKRDGSRTRSASRSKSPVIAH